MPTSVFGIKKASCAEVLTLRTAVEEKEEGGSWERVDRKAHWKI